MQSKEGVQCFTDGCGGQVKLAQELEEEAGVDTHKRELLRLPDLPRKPERAQQPQEQPEPRRARKKGPVQRAPEPGKGLNCYNLLGSHHCLPCWLLQVIRAESFRPTSLFCVPLLHSLYLLRIGRAYQKFAFLCLHSQSIL